MKKIMVIIGSLLVLLLLVLLALPYLLDLNKYRNQYMPIVERTLNRKVEVSHVHMMWFPHLGIQLEDARVFDDSAISPDPFVTVSSIEIAVRWKPLLSRRVEIQSLTLRQPTVTIIRTIEGSFNTATVGNQQESHERGLKENHPGQSLLAMFGVEQLTISEGTLRYEDRVQKQVQTSHIEDLEMKTEAVRLGAIAKFSLQGTLTPYNLPLSLEGRLGPLREDLDISQIDAQLTLGNSSVVANGQIVNGILDLDISSSKLSSDDFPTMVQMSTPIEVTQVFAHIKAPLPMANRSTTSSKKSIINPLNFQVTAGESIVSFSGQTVGTNLEIHGTAPTIYSKDLSPFLPLHNSVTLNNLRVTANITGPHVQIVRLTGEIFDGNLEAEGQWNGTHAVPTFQSTGRIQNVNTEKAQKIINAADVTLVGEGSIDWDFSGTLPLDGIPLLQGHTQLKIVNGRLMGFDLLEKIEHVLRLKNALGKDRGITTFSTMNGTVIFQNDRYKIKTVSLKGTNNEYFMQGSGLVRPNQLIAINGHLRLGSNVSRKIIQQLPIAKVALQDDEIEVPFVVSGVLVDPKIGLDFGSIQRRVQQQIGNTIEKVLQGDPKDVQEIIKQGKGFLKQLFGK